MKKRSLLALVSGLVLASPLVMAQDMSTVTACWSCKFDTRCGTAPLVGSTCPNGDKEAGVRWTSGACPDYSLVATPETVQTLKLMDLITKKDPNCEVPQEQGDSAAPAAEEQEEGAPFEEEHDEGEEEQ